MEGVVAVTAVFVVLFGLGSGWLRRRSVTGPMVALAVGVLLGPVLGILPTSIEADGVLLFVELTLVIVLFVDATRVDLRLALRNGSVPVRMLVIGFPLVVLAGTVAGSVVLGLAVGPALVLACVLAPTDAALAQPVLADDRLPRRVRQALNVESGLNDGLAAPLLVIALVVAEVEARDTATLVLDVLRLLGLGAVVGLLVGGLLGLALRRIDWHTLAPAARQVATAAAAVVAFAGASLVDGNGFVAAFVAGVTFGALVPSAHELVEFAEDAVELLSLLTFLVFGAVFVAPASTNVSPAVVVYVVLTLTVVRMLPIALSLVGTGLRLPTVALVGWFGPRGLASVVFGLEVLELGEDGALPAGETLFGIASLVVVVSVIAHGLSARPAAGAYARHLEQEPLTEDTPEGEDVPDLPMRGSS